MVCAMLVWEREVVRFEDEDCSLVEVLLDN
jgi:hypothetical protein